MTKRRWWEYLMKGFGGYMNLLSGRERPRLVETTYRVCFALKPRVVWDEQASSPEAAACAYARKTPEEEWPYAYPDPLGFVDVAVFDYGVYRVTYDDVPIPEEHIKRKPRGHVPGSLYTRTFYARTFKARLLGV